MVRLTLTRALLDVYTYCKENGVDISRIGETGSSDASLGNPISHTQLIALSTLLREHSKTSRNQELPPHDLRTLLKGSRVYVEPAKPKSEPSAEYKQLMARLREEEDERAYDRMINPPLPIAHSKHRLATTGNVQLFPPVSKQEEDEEVTFADINRQVTLIFNILISIVACAVAIWIATRYWPTPQRLGVSMGGGGLVGVAEVVVYAGYLRRVKEAKQKEKRKVEKKQIIDTWVIEPKPGSRISDTAQKNAAPDMEGLSLRRRVNAKS